jgi:hypothetical protein
MALIPLHRKGTPKNRIFNRASVQKKSVYPLLDLSRNKERAGNNFLKSKPDLAGFVFNLPGLVLTLASYLRTTLLLIAPVF